MYKITRDGHLALAMDTLKTMFSMPEPRIQKCEFLFDIARNVKRGAIVELGTYHGTGTIAICMGVEAGGLDEIIVYTVDDFKEKSGWANEPYGPKDEDIFYKNIDDANVNPILIKNDSLTAALNFNCQVGFLFWDTGIISYNGVDPAMTDDLRAWNNHLMPGAIVLLRDTYENHFRHGETVDTMKNEFDIIHEERSICVLKKK